MIRAAFNRVMTRLTDVPQWVAELIARIAEYQQDALMFDLRELPDEARDARLGADAAIRHLARRLSERGL